MSDIKNVVRAFEHLIDLLEEEDIDRDVIHAVEEAHALFEETYQNVKGTEEE